ncbi:MAG: alpha/beta hydrolase [Candidatus Sericytochromatia bacterium]
MTKPKRLQKLLGLLTTGLTLSLPFRVQAGELGNDLATLRNSLPPLSLQGSFYSQAYLRYLAYYRLPAQNARQAGYLQVHKGKFKEKIFVQYFRPDHPERPRGTIFLTHGYFVHAGIQHYAVKEFLGLGYAVLTIDLPGHGLSTGKQADISQFSDYTDTFQAVTEFAQNQVPHPLLAVGHSTGAAGIWSYLLRTPDHPFQAVVLAAPLVRSHLWELSLAGFTVGQAFLTELPRIVRSTTSDPDFMDFVQRDPLQYFNTPVNWVRALITWNEQVVESFPPSQLPTLIVQGDRDEVVDWKFNLPFLKRKFPKAQIQMVNGASHDLFWENAQLRQDIFARIRTFVQSLPPEK